MKSHTFLASSFTGILLLCSLFLVACSGGGGGSDDGDLSGGIVDGGIGGTGLGTITRFSSIVVNDTRVFDLTPETNISIDGESVQADDLAVGMVVNYDVADDVSATFDSGTAVNVAAFHQVVGPITTGNPLSVLGQTVVVDGGTVLSDIPGGVTGNLVIGSIVEVAGYRDVDGIIRASRLAYKPSGLPVWVINGRATEVVPNQGFRVGAQQIVLNGIVPEDCSGGLVDGALVEVKAPPVPDFNSGDFLAVNRVECQLEGLQVPDNPATSLIKAEIEGFVTQVVLPGEFVVDGQTVITDSATEFEGGTAADIVLGAKLEVEGDFDTLNGILRAREIEIEESRVNIVAPVLTADIDIGKSMDIMGITVFANAQTEDEDGIISEGNGNIQADVEGYIDIAGDVIATDIKADGSINSGSVDLRGPASNIAPPLFQILGLTIDTNTVNELPADFFPNLVPGATVKIEDAQWDGDDTLSGGKLEIDG